MSAPDPTIRDSARNVDAAARLAGWLYEHRRAVWLIVVTLAGGVGTAGTMLARHEARIVRLEEHRLATDVRQERIESVIERVENKVDRALEGQARILGFFEALPMYQPQEAKHDRNSEPEDRTRDRQTPRPRGAEQAQP